MEHTLKIGSLGSKYGNSSEGYLPLNKMLKYEVGEGRRRPRLAVRKSKPHNSLFSLYHFHHYTYSWEIRLLEFARSKKMWGWETLT